MTPEQLNELEQWAADQYANAVYDNRLKSSNYADGLDEGLWMLLHHIRFNYLQT